MFKVTFFVNASRPKTKFAKQLMSKLLPDRTLKVVTTVIIITVAHGRIPYTVERMR